MQEVGQAQPINTRRLAGEHGAFSTSYCEPVGGDIQISAQQPFGAASAWHIHLHRSELRDRLGQEHAVPLVARELMEAEISGEIGAGRGEVSRARQTHRNGYRSRAWETRVGEIELAIPRKREGEAYFPSFLEPRRPAEQALLAVVMEAYVNGV
jgi:hypothetical protein